MEYEAAPYRKLDLNVYFKRIFWIEPTRETDYFKLLRPT